MQARDLMTPDPHVVAVEESISLAARLMRDLHLGCLPVVADRATLHLSGVITDRDIVVRCMADAPNGDARVGDYMTADFLATVPPDAEVAEVGRILVRQGLRRLLVTERGKLIGLISRTDLARKVGWLRLSWAAHQALDSSGDFSQAASRSRDRARMESTRTPPAWRVGGAERIADDPITFREFLQVPTTESVGESAQPSLVAYGDLIHPAGRGVEEC
jgi:CBS domain-containing protein